MAKEKKEADPQDKILERAVQEVRKRWGVESIHIPGEEVTINKEVISTGITPLDNVLGNGGLAKGSIVEIFGGEGAGKSTICLQIIAQAQKQGMKTLFIDQEHALDTRYAEAIGVCVEDMYIAQPDSMEEALGIVETMVATGSFGLVIVDSIASLVPKVEIEKPLEEQTMGLQPRLMSTWLRRFNPVIASTDTILIFTNQLRDKLTYMGGSTTPGGKAIRFYSSYRIEVKIIEKLKGPDGQFIGNKLRITAVKNKKHMPYGTAEVKLIFGEGIDAIDSLIGDALAAGLIVKSGSWYELSKDYFEEGRAQGRSGMKTYLIEHPVDMQKLESILEDYKEMGFNA